MDNEDYEVLIKYGKTAFSNDCNWRDNESIIWNGSASFTRMDLLVIYKINRMFELNLITEEQSRSLMDLYERYLMLEEDLLFSEYDPEREDEFETIYRRLAELHLLPDSVTLGYLMDDSIKNDSGYRLLLEEKK